MTVIFVLARFIYVDIVSRGLLYFSVLKIVYFVAACDLYYWYLFYLIFSLSGWTFFRGAFFRLFFIDALKQQIMQDFHVSVYEICEMIYNFIIVDIYIQLSNQFTAIRNNFYLMQFSLVRLFTGQCNKRRLNIFLKCEIIVNSKKNNIFQDASNQLS